MVECGTADRRELHIDVVLGVERFAVDGVERHWINNGGDRHLDVETFDLDQVEVRCRSDVLEATDHEFNVVSTNSQVGVKGIAVEVGVLNPLWVLERNFEAFGITQNDFVAVDGVVIQWGTSGAVVTNLDVAELVDLVAADAATAAWHDDVAGCTFDSECLSEGTVLVGRVHPPTFDEVNRDHATGEFASEGVTERIGCAGDQRWASVEHDIGGCTSTEGEFFAGVGDRTGIERCSS